MIKLKLDLSVIWVPIITLLFCYSPLGGVVGCASDKEFFVKLQFCQLLEADPAPGPRPIWASWWALRITRKKKLLKVIEHFTSTCPKSSCVLLPPGWLFGEKYRLTKIKVKFKQEIWIQREHLELHEWQTQQNTIFCFVEILREFDFILFWAATVPLVQQL